MKREKQIAILGVMILFSGLFPRLARASGEQVAITEKLVGSLERMAKATTQSRALIYRKAAERLSSRKEYPSITGIMHTLCGNELVAELVLPIIEGTSSKAFERTVVKARKLPQLLSASAGDHYICELLHTDQTEWAIGTLLALTQSGWNAP